MPKPKKIKAIIDTNLFISFLIGKKLKSLKQRLCDASVELIFAEQNLLEIRMVTSRNKFRKYFELSKVEDLINFIQTTGKIFEIVEIAEICRDPKDDFLLALAVNSSADYLVTGDKDLLNIGKIGQTAIVSIDEFEKILDQDLNSGNGK
jgi:putative PIN family toxin of toxin-antitoxin system